MAYNIKPSIGMLPIEDLSNVFKEKGFMTEISTEDIEKVTRKKITQNQTETYMQGIFEPYNIALSTGEIVNGEIDRETIKNAKNLNNRPAQDYLVVEDKEKLIERNESLSRTYSDEIQLLRDELYNMKSELIKMGHLEDTDVAKGFIDSFKNFKIKYDKLTSDILEINGESVRQAQNIFNEKDWVAILKDKNKENEITIDKVTSKNGNDITFKNGTAGLNLSTSLLKKSTGEYKRGTYSFSKTTYNTVGMREKYSGLNDDVDLKEKDITKTNSGFATIIRVPSRHSGFLSRLVIQGKKIGNPGALICHVIKGDIKTIENLAKNNKITDMIINDECYAKSAPVYDVEKTYKEITFDFTNLNYNIGQEGESLYPEILGGNEYCFIIESSNVSENDYWVIEFGTNKGVDLQSNNKTFIFNRSLPDSQISELSNLEDERDIFYTLVVKEKEEEAEIPFKCGLYTTASPIKLSEPIKATRARLTLEINKEGKFSTSSKGLMRKNIDAIEFRNAITGAVPEQTVICGGDKIIIGNEIATVISSSPGSVVIDKSMYIEKDSPLYRVGYEAQVRVRLIERDAITQLPIIKEGSERFYSLQLKAVIPSGRTAENPTSDRLIFEADFDGFEVAQKIADRCDVNNDKVVTQTDVELISSYYNNNNPEIIKKYDINEDGKIDGFDTECAEKYINHKVGTRLAEELEFNEITLQIKWQGNLISESSRLQLKNGNDYVGRIKNLSLAFDKII